MGVELKLALRYAEHYLCTRPDGVIALVGPLQAVTETMAELRNHFPSAEFLELPQQTGWSNRKYGEYLLSATADRATKLMVLICGQVDSGVSYCHNATVPLKLRGDLVVTIQGRVIHTAFAPAPLKTMNQGEMLSYAGRFLSVKEPGDFLEFGTLDGRSLTLAWHVLNKRVRRFFGFDSFEGIIGANSDEAWQDGTFVSNRATLHFNMEVAGCDMARFVSVQGNFIGGLTPNLYEELGLDVCLVAHIDCDVYSPAKAALDFLTPLLRQGSVLLFDDFHGNAASNRTGERRALREWLDGNPHIQVEPLFDYSVIGRSYVVHVG